MGYLQNAAISYKPFGDEQAKKRTKTISKPVTQQQLICFAQQHPGKSGLEKRFVGCYNRGIIFLEG